jgi:hypothetical protein
MYNILREQHKHSAGRVSLFKRHVSTSSHRHRKVTYSHHDVAKKMLGKALNKYQAVFLQLKWIRLWNIMYDLI